MKKTYALLNLLVIIAVIYWNYISSTVGIKGNTISSLSSEYENLFTPAGYAFAIWGIIYLGLIAHGIYQLKKVFFDKKGDDFILQIGPWLILANLANAAWIFLWLNENTGLSVVAMLTILLSLLMIILRLNMERWDAPIGIIAFVWWPICLYSGWIAVASIANISAWLAKMEWQALFSEITWAVIMIIIAALLNLFMIITRNMREFALVGVWALMAIAAKHWDTIPELKWTATLSAIVIFIAVSIHGYKNRKTNPFAKLRKA